jgi:Delta7-sterol 5-desaturase
MHLYATRRLPYIADSEAFATPANALRVLLWTATIPLVRGVHFYFAHRLIHVKVIYKYVHSLHHRNIDIEPFAGLSMYHLHAILISWPDDLWIDRDSRIHCWLCCMAG